MEELTKEQHDYLMAAGERKEGKNDDEVFTGFVEACRSATCPSVGGSAILPSHLETRLRDMIRGL